MPIHNLTITQLIAQLQARTLSSVELTEYYLGRVERLDKHYNSFITCTPELALAQARTADALLAKGGAHPLCGVPLAHKDNFCTEGVRTSCASKMLDNFVPPYNATVVDNYLKAGMVTLGKLNMDEFAMGCSNESSYYGPVKNPWNTACVPGGSSGGSAAAVAARITPAATATDTGGSIRQPASLCGITGIKPTYGRVSRWGVVAFASSLDQAGLLARNAEDAAILLNTMAGYDAKDSTSVDEPAADYTAPLTTSLKGLKIGVPEAYFGEGLAPATASAVQEALLTFESLGASLVAIDLPHSNLAIAAYYVIAAAECSANLSRFDGVRYGYRCDNPENLEDLYKRSRSEGFGDEVKRRIMIGCFALSSGYYDAYYAKAQKARRLIQQDFIEAFKSVDLILGPTSPSTAFEIGTKSTDPVAMYLEDIYTTPTNLAGLPGMSIPCGVSEGKPIGLQLTGGYFREALLLNAAHQFQQATSFHLESPPNIEFE